MDFIDFVIEDVFIPTFRLLLQVKMYMRKVTTPQVKSYEVERLGPTVAFECPTCSSEVSLNEIVEDKGNIRCVKCA